jgi:hypothetical protein
MTKAASPREEREWAWGLLSSDGPGTYLLTDDDEAFPRIVGSLRDHAYGSGFYKPLVDEWYHWLSDEDGLRLGQHADR